MNCLTGQFVIRDRRRTLACESNLTVSFFPGYYPKIRTAYSAHYPIKPADINCFSWVEPVARIIPFF